MCLHVKVKNCLTKKPLNAQILSIYLLQGDVLIGDWGFTSNYAQKAPAMVQNPPFKKGKSNWGYNYTYTLLSYKLTTKLQTHYNIKYVHVQSLIRSTPNYEEYFQAELLLACKNNMFMRSS